MKKCVLEIAVFFCGASIMTMELVGSRILAPYMGTSIYVWTSLIGVILGALSFGYWWGGRLSDRQPDVKVFSRIVFIAGVWIAGIAFLSDLVLIAIQGSIDDSRLAAVVATLVLFAGPSVLLGVVLPYAARLKIVTVDKTGETVGTLYALSTVGSILGTFLAGFYFIAYWNNITTLLFIGGVLVLVSVALHSTKFSAAKLVLLFVFLLGAWQSDSVGAMIKGPGVIDVNTRYNRVWIYDGFYRSVKGPVRYMQVNEEHDSGIALENNDLVFPYTKYYRLDNHFKPGFNRALMIGGAAYTYPMDFLRRYPKATIDVVEIDPGVTALAKKYFRMREDPRMVIYHEDARTFLNREHPKYDVIYGDAFKSYSIPFQLTTRQAVKRIYDLLNDDGVILLNVISAINGEKGEVLRAQIATYKTVFPQVYVYAVSDREDGERPQNLLLVALKSKERPKPYSLDAELNTYLQSVWIHDIADDMPVLEDSFAPVERYGSKISRSTRKESSPVFLRWREILKRLSGGK
jgi:spermidine synthase